MGREEADHVADQNGERESIYGETRANFNAIHALKEAWRTHNNRNHGDAHDHAIEMILVKIGRIATGVYHEDNYVDIEGYAKIADRVAIKIKRREV